MSVCNVNLGPIRDLSFRFAGILEASDFVRAEGSEWLPSMKQTVAIGSWGSGPGYPAPDLLGTADIECKGRGKGFFRTGGNTGVAEYAFGGEDPLTLFHVCRNVDIHRADLGAGTAIVASLGIAGDFERGESGGQFEGYHNGTGVLAECPVVFEGEG